MIMRHPADQAFRRWRQCRAAADHGREIGEFSRTRHLAPFARLLQATLRRFFGAFTAAFGFFGHQCAPAVCSDQLRRGLQGGLDEAPDAQHDVVQADA